jgi:hypothetical protein
MGTSRDIASNIAPERTVTFEISLLKFILLTFLFAGLYSNTVQMQTGVWGCPDAFERLKAAA